MLHYKLGCQTGHPQPSGHGSLLDRVLFRTGLHKWLVGACPAQPTQMVGWWALVRMHTDPPLMQVELCVCAPAHHSFMLACTRVPAHHLHGPVSSPQARPSSSKGWGPYGMYHAMLKCNHHQRIGLNHLPPFFLKKGFIYLSQKKEITGRGREIFISH